MDCLELRRRVMMDQPHPVVATPTSLVTFDTNMVGKLKDCKVHFSPVQSGSGDPSPTNVRPISGWNGVKVWRSGKNLAEKMLGYDSVGGNATSTSIRIDTTGNVVTSLISVKPGLKYAMSYTGTGVNSRYFWFDSYPMRGDVISIGGQYAVKNVIATAPENARYMFIVWTRTEQTQTVGDVQVEIANLPSEIVPYNGTTLPIDWTDSAGTIYGGYVDLVRGEVVAEWEKLTYNGQFVINQLASHIMATVTRSYFVTTQQALPDVADRTVSYCNMGKRKSSGYATNEVGFFFGSNIEINIYTGNDLTGIVPGTDTAETARAKVMAYYAENPIEICWKINPIHHPIDPVTLKTLRGINNVWSDAGDIELTYYKH